MVSKSVLKTIFDYFKIVMYTNFFMLAYLQLLICLDSVVPWGICMNCFKISFKNVFWLCLKLWCTLIFLCMLTFNFSLALILLCHEESVFSLFHVFVIFSSARRKMISNQVSYQNILKFNHSPISIRNKNCQFSCQTYFVRI